MDKNCFNCKHYDQPSLSPPHICVECMRGEEPFPLWEAKSITKADRFRAMTDEELAEWLAEVLFHCSNTICDERCPMYKCCCDQSSDNIEDWLKQEETDAD